MMLNRWCILLLIVLLFKLSSVMITSIESALIPVPLFFTVCHVVLQLSPGRK